MSSQHTPNGSTGPRTPEGKATSSRNALKHGLRSALVYIPEGLKEEFAVLSEHYTAAFLKPNCTAAQKIMFDELLKAAWTVERIQLAMIGQGLGTATCDPISRWDYEKLQKHLTRTEASFRFYLKQLQSIQTNEVLAEILPELTERTLPPLVNSKYIANTIKRTAKTQAEKSDFADLNGV